ncbi:MAG: hypothetical protein ICV71_00425 [Thermoleophilia bacterium]|nr:hypothetical protein [Thermoleophilia bacterium]
MAAIDAFLPRELFSRLSQVGESSSASRFVDALRGGVALLALALGALTLRRRTP